MLTEDETKLEKIEIQMATGDSVPDPLPPTPLPPSPTLTLNESTETVTETGTQVPATTTNIRTIFVSGLPMDTTPRELYLLFRNSKGFVESRLSTARNKYGKILSPVGFVTFEKREEAEEAMKDLQDTSFDPYLQNTLRLEFAKCNSKILKDNLKKPYSPSLPASTTVVNPIFFRNSAALRNSVLRESTGQTHYPWNHSSVSGSSIVWPQGVGGNNPYSQGTGGLEVSPYYNSERYVDSVFGSSSSILSSPSLYSLPSTQALNSSQSLTSQTPCSTLFVANLGSFVGEQEVNELFGNCPGFVHARLYTKGLTPVAFVKFMDVRCASQAMMTLQGAFLQYPTEYKCDRGGIRIEYAKSKMNNLDGGNSPMEPVGFTGGDNNHNGWTPYPLVPLDSLIDHRETRDWPSGVYAGLDHM